jgi:transposase
MYSYACFKPPRCRVRRASGLDEMRTALTDKLVEEQTSHMNKNTLIEARPEKPNNDTDSIVAVIGIDLGDRRSSYCLLDCKGTLIGDGTVATTAEAFKTVFGGTGRMRIAVECGTHSPWVSWTLQQLGHEVIVANARRLRLISESDRKNDKADARTLAKLAQAAPDLLAPVHHRSEQVQFDLATIKARDAAIRSRTAIISAIRGIVKSTGSRLAVCSTGVFAKTAIDTCPAALRDALLPLMRIVQELTNEIREYDRAIALKAKQEYPETSAILTIPGVGPLTALTFVLLLNNDPRRIPRSRDLGCYFGLQPRQQDSGKHVSQLGITKAGDNLMRKLAVQCAHFMLGKFGKDSVLRRWGLALALRGGKNAKKRAVVAVARKLIILMHRLWKTQESFAPFYGCAIEPNAA